MNEYDLTEEELFEVQQSFEDLYWVNGELLELVCEEPQ